MVDALARRCPLDSPRRALIDAHMYDTGCVCVCVCFAATHHRGVGVLLAFVVRLRNVRIVREAFIKCAIATTK